MLLFSVIFSIIHYVSDYARQTKLHGHISANVKSRIMCYYYYSRCIDYVLIYWLCNRAAFSTAPILSVGAMLHLPLTYTRRPGVYTLRDTVDSRIQCESKKIPPRVFWKFFPNGWEFLINFLHTYYAIIYTLDYKFLFKYLQLWLKLCHTKRDHLANFYISLEL